MLSQTFIDEMQAKLLAEKDRLGHELAGLHKHTELGGEEDDSSNELQLDEVNQDLITRIQADLAKIEKALGKIANGTYGTDDDGIKIAEERLRVIPWADKAI